MAKLRNISPDTLIVPLLGRSVDPDEVVEVADALLEQYAWPDTLWAVVTPSKKPTESKEVI
jgi:hypothetical protein